MTYSLSLISLKNFQQLHLRRQKANQAWKKANMFALSMKNHDIFILE